MLPLSFPTQNNLTFTKCWPLRLVATVLVLITIARAQSTEKVLVNLGIPGSNGGLTFDQKGNLYGTMSGGLIYNPGTVFKLRHYPDGIWGNKLLYRFNGAPDGAHPQSHPIFDSAGNLYGTTAAGGIGDCHVNQYVVGCGTVFKLTPTPTGEWTETVLYQFPGTDLGLGRPSAGVISDSAGNLYGTSSSWDICSSTVFELMPGPNGTWTEKLLYRFTDCFRTTGGLVQDNAGNLYGTRPAGGTTGRGIIYELSPAPGTWTYHLLYSFCSRTNCTDGGNPASGVILDKYGNLYGTASLGGLTSCGNTGDGCGTAFKLSRGLNGAWTFHLLHTFVYSDGTNPYNGLVFDSIGNLYGTTSGGSAATGGTVFKLSHVPGSPWSLETLYSFCALPGCADGAGPSGSLVLDSAGDLYGTTANGGKGGWGVVFEITP